MSTFQLFPTMSTTTTTATQILHHTTTFFTETLTQPTHRHQLFTSFLTRLPQNLIKPFTFASQTLENAISTASSSTRSSSLRLAQKLLRHTSSQSFSHFLLSIVYFLTSRDLEASITLLDVFIIDPTLARSEIAPFLFQELFLVHFLPLIEWYNEKRSSVLLELGDLNGNGTLLSRMSGGQASELKELERVYEDLLDENVRRFVEFFKEVLRDKNGEKVIVPPAIVLRKESGRVEFREVVKVESREFGLTNRRYNPIWTEGDGSVDFNSNKSKSLSNLPSLVPERVSPKVLTNQRSSKTPKNNLVAELQSAASYDLSDCSSLDSEPEQEQKTKIMALFDFKQNQTQKQKQLLFAEDSSFRPPDPLMEDIQNSPVSGKQTPPKDFVCPITTHIFNDPVTLETGQTYERKAIQEWIDRGNSTCPITRQKLNGTQLPKTNYVLKRLIASWKQKNPSQSEIVQPVEEVKYKPEIISVSPNSVISQATVNETMNELRHAINDICTSEILEEAETAVLKIEKFWKANTEPEILSVLSKPPVINGFVEVLFNSVDAHVLKATILLLTELGLRYDNVIQTLTRVDSDVECIIELFKKGLLEAVVLIFLLKPRATSLVEMEIVDHLLEMISKEDDDSLIKMCMKPKTASLFLLGDILRNYSEESLSGIVRSIVSTEVIDRTVEGLRSEQVKERIASVSILLRCVLVDGKCRNIVAEKAELAPVVDSFIGLSDVEQFDMVHFLSEIVKLNRRDLIERILHILKDEGAFSTMHTLLIYLQSALQDQSSIVAGLLLQLDLLDEPRKMSIYREEAVDTLIFCLRNSEFPLVQITAAETVLSLQGRFSYSGKSLARAILLKRAGLDRNYKAFMRKDQRHQNISAEAQDTVEETRACEEWERKVAFVLVSHEFGLLFEALAEGLKSRYEELRSVCFMTATWLVYMLSILPDTGIRGAARVCLLKHFVTIFKSEKNIEDRALAMLALNTFISDPEGLQDLAPHMKDILKGLREIRKSSALAFQLLNVFSDEHENSADIWNHKELGQEDCNINGEILSITCYKDKIFSGHTDGTIKVWGTGGLKLRLIQEVREHMKPVTSLAVLHSSEKLYSGSFDRTVRVWSVSEEGIYCEQVHEMKDQINNLVVANSMACYIPQGAGIKVHSWNGSSKLVNQNKYAKCVALVQGKLYCGCQDTSIQEIDLVTGTLGNIQSGTKKLLGKACPINALQVHDGLIYAAGHFLDGANVKIWNASNYSIVGSLQSTLDVRSMAVSSELVYIGGKGGLVEVWCKKKYNRVETLQSCSTAKILCMALDTTEDMLVIGTSDGKIQTWGLC